MMRPNLSYPGLVLKALASGSLLTACQPASVTPDPAQLARAVQGTLQVVGTQLAFQETLTATALRPTETTTPSLTPTPTATLTPTPTPTATPTPLPNGVVKEAGPLRAGPSQVFPIIQRLSGGERLMLLGQTAGGDWLSVIVEDGPPGWLPLSNIEFPGDLATLPILTDLPPTPTVPPPTWTPLPTPTDTPSPYTCEFYVTHSPAVGEVLLIGTHWPPNTDITVSIDGRVYAWLTIPSDELGAFQISVSYSFGSIHQYGVSSFACSRTVQFP